LTVVPESEEPEPVVAEPVAPDPETPDTGELAGRDEPDVLGGELEAGGELDEAVGVVIPPWHAVSETPTRQAAAIAAAVRYTFIGRSPFHFMGVRVVTCDARQPLCQAYRAVVAALRQVTRSWRDRP
jgi:hypothetical protein